MNKNFLTLIAALSLGAAPLAQSSNCPLEALRLVASSSGGGECEQQALALEVKADDCSVASDCSELSLVSADECELEPSACTTERSLTASSLNT